MSFLKRFPTTVPQNEIQREARLQRLAASIGVAPKVKRCTKSTLGMVHLNAPCLAEKYGDTMEDIPLWIQEDILDILYTLYTTFNIQYLDVTPYNFIEHDGVVWVIDFGHAHDRPEELDPYLDELFASWTLAKWNPEFA